jgi:hypothetical protein
MLLLVEDLARLRIPNPLAIEVGASVDLAEDLPALPVALLTSARPGL